MTTDIQITKSGQEPGAASFKVEVATERVRKAEHQAAQTIAKRARLPGFRKGKAPLAVIKRRYHDAIREQVLRDVIGETWKTTLEQEKLEPIAEPHIHDVRFEEGTPLTFELHVELKPDITLDRLGGFAITRTTKPVTDEMVDTQLEELRRQRAPWVPVEDRHPQPGDLVHGTLATIEDGEPGEAREFNISLGDGQAIPDVEAKLMTLSIGETADAVVRFPEDFPDETKRGQSREVRLSLSEVKTRDLPALDDGFAREVGDFETLGDLRKAIRDDLEADARREADAGVRRQLLEQVVAANSVPAPRPLVDRLLRAYAESYEIPQENLETFITEFRPIAEAQVKRDLVLNQVAMQHDRRATEEELDDRIAEIAARRNVDPGTVYAELQKSNRLRELEQALTEEKVFDYLLQQSTVTES